MTYTVEYKLYQAADIKRVTVAARNKIEAYERAVYEAIKEKEGELPYSAWVSSVTYSNGNCKRFNTFEGKRF